MARLAKRRHGVWLGLEGSIDCLPAMRRALSGGAIVDLESLSRLPYGFTAVLAADTLEHLSDCERMLGLIHAALPPGGLLLVSVPNVANLYVRLALLCGRFPYSERGILDRSHRIFFTRASLRELLRRQGFRIEREAVSVVPVPLAFPRLPGWMLGLLIRLLDPLTRLLPTLFGYQLLAIGRRQDKPLGDRAVTPV